MTKVFYALLLSVFLFSCSDDDESNPLDKDNPTDFKTVKVVLTRTSSNHSIFFGGSVLTVPSSKTNNQYNDDDFDMVLDNDGNTMLGKLYEPLTAKQEYTIKQKTVKIQVIDTPQLFDEIDPDTDEFDLTTKIDIFVNENLVKSEIYVFSEFSVPNLLQYSE